MDAEEFLNRKPLTPELCGCGCGNPLEKNDPQGPQQMVVGGKTVFVNPDCYIDSISEIVETSGAIGGLGTHGPRMQKCLLDD